MKLELIKEIEVKIITNVNGNVLFLSSVIA